MQWLKKDIAFFISGYLLWSRNKDLGFAIFIFKIINFHKSSEYILLKRETEISKKEALSYAVKYCSKEEKCLFDIRNKLEGLHVTENDIEDILNYLVEEKFVDESRYARAFVNDKFRFNKWGKNKIRFALKQKHIKENVIDEALEGITVDEGFGLLLDELQKKMKNTHSTSTYELKGKLYRFAVGRGYENDIILKALETLLSKK